MKVSQANKILHFMRINPAGITTHQSIDLFGCTRLSARIADLKKRGYSIKTDHIKVPTRDGETTYVARYRLNVEDKVQ